MSSRIEENQMSETKITSENGLDLLEHARSRMLDDQESLTLDELSSLSELDEPLVPQLAQLAHEVRLDRCGDLVEIEGIVSVKTGGCTEDCAFCSQSSQYDTTVKATAFLDLEEVMQAATETLETGATEFCIVLAVKGPDEKIMGKLEEIIPAVAKKTGLNVSVSAGILNQDQAKRLAQVGTHRYNHNLETARSFFSQIVSTHSWEQRVETCNLVTQAGMGLCCGVLLGMGETTAQRIELIGQLREVDPIEVPINFLNPRPGTPLANRERLSAIEAIRWIALFRLGLPSVILKYAGGREVTLGELQAMGMTSGINSLIVGNYLTTLGRSPQEDLAMLEELSMPVGALAVAI